MSEINKAYCCNCRYMNQAQGSAACFNPNQTSEELINYVSYASSCDLFDDGEQQSESELKKLGYQKMFEPINYADGTSGGWDYYKKKEPVITP